MSNYNNELHKHKAADTIKWIVAFVLIIAIMGAVVCLALQVGGVFDFFKEKDDAPDVSEIDDVLVLDPISSKYVKLLATTAEDGNSKRLKATVLPDTASDKTVDWSISWNNAGDFGSLLSAKVTEFVTVTPTADGALTATVKCLQPFDHQIIITVASRLNPEAKATCTVDYKEPLEYRLVPYDGSTVNVNQFNIERVKGKTYTIPIQLDESTIQMKFEFTEEFWSGCHFGILSGGLGTVGKFYTLYDDNSRDYMMHKITPKSATADIISISPNFTGVGAFGGYYNFNLEEYLPFIAGDKDSGYYLLHGNALSMSDHLSNNQKVWNIHSVVYPFFPAWSDYGSVELGQCDLMLEWLRNHALKDAISNEITIANLVFTIQEKNGGQTHEFKFSISDCKMHKADVQVIADSYIILPNSMTVDSDNITFGG